jgi:hypothetical protein
MTEKQSILIGDEKHERAERLRQLLQNYYNATAQTADTLDQMCMMARQNPGSVVFLTDSLPFGWDYRMAIPHNNFHQLHGADRSAQLVCVVTGDEAPMITGLSAPVYYIRLSSAAPTKEEQSRIVADLQPLKDILPLATITYESLAALTTFDPSDLSLQKQISSLSNLHDLTDGWHQFHKILRECLDFRNIKSVDVHPLNQGKSGALVFRLQIRSATQNGGTKDEVSNFVLKLSPTEAVWKLQSEVRGYLEAARTDLYTTYKKHVPALQTPNMPRALSRRGPTDEEFKYIASSLPWDAIYYDFLGGDLGECMTLETALVSSPDKILKRSASVCNQSRSSWICSAGTDLPGVRINFLRTLLDALCDIWYLSKSSKRKKKIPWSRKNADDRVYSTLPPYQFTERTKDWIREFLNDQESEIGRRLFGEWDQCRNRLLSLVDDHKGAKPLGVLGEKIPMIVSPVHGDLNSGNAFLWLRQEKFPFLIDLPFFQSEGHVLQDFARLEVEVKFTLMDRQEESPAKELPAFDLCSQQMSIWRELEDNLLVNRTARRGEPHWRSIGFQNNVRLTYQLIKVIRDKAASVHQTLSSADTYPDVDFMDEYSIALLYHTTRAVTYPSLSLFKRLFAVYSAGSILKRFGF